MIEDMQHLETLRALSEELQANLVRYNARTNGATDKRVLIATRLEQNEALTELLKAQRRALLFMSGETVEPETHFGEGVLVGVGFQS